MGPEFDPFETMAFTDSQRHQPAPRPMWTDLRPGRDGVYWMKTPAGDPRIVQLMSSFGKWSIALPGTPNVAEIGSEACPRGTLWYGPIEPPPITTIKRAL